MKRYIINIIHNLVDEFDQGCVFLDTTDEIPWSFYLAINTNIEGKVKSVEGNAPTLVISDLEKTAGFLEEYLKRARVFYGVEQSRYDLTKESFDKKLIFDLIANGTNYDLCNFEQYVQVKTEMLKKAEKIGKINLGLMELPFGKVRAMVSISKNESKLEGPYKFEVYFENEQGSFALPSSTFGIVGNKVFIYTIQAKKGKQDSRLAKKMDRYFRKFNKGLDMAEPEAQVSTNALAALTTFVTYMQANGIKEFFAPAFLPARYIAKDLSNLHRISDESLVEEQEKLDRNQFNMTNKFLYTAMRFAWHFDEYNFEFDELRERVCFSAGKGPREKSDNEIYDFQNVVGENVKNLQMGK